MPLFCWTQRKIFWRMWKTEQFWGTIDFHSIFLSYYGSQWCPKTAWLQTFFRISSFVFGRTKKFIQVWNYLRDDRIYIFGWTIPLSHCARPCGLVFPFNQRSSDLSWCLLSLLHISPGKKLPITIESEHLWNSSHFKPGRTWSQVRTLETIKTFIRDCIRTLVNDQGNASIVHLTKRNRGLV